MFMYGGAVKNTATDEFWEFNFTSSRWSPVAAVGTTKPFATVGHTAQVVGSFMFVFFGHSPTYGFLNTVQCFSFGESIFSRNSTKVQFIFSCVFFCTCFYNGWLIDKLHFNVVSYISKTFLDVFVGFMKNCLVMVSLMYMI